MNTDPSLKYEGLSNKKNVYQEGNNMSAALNLNKCPTVDKIYSTHCMLPDLHRPTLHACSHSQIDFYLNIF